MKQDRARFGVVFLKKQKKQIELKFEIKYTDHIDKVLQYRPIISFFFFLSYINNKNRPQMNTRVEKKR
jgi:hypothetical protein